MIRRRRLERLLLSVSSFALVQTTLLSPAAAQHVWTGNVNSDWFTAGNWTPASVPGSTVQIELAASTPVHPFINGAFASLVGSVSVGTTGLLTIHNGGALALATNDNIIIGGGAVGASATVTVTGQGSTLNGNGGSVFVGNSAAPAVGPGTLNVLNGAGVHGFRIDVALNPNTHGHAVVSGAGTSITVPGAISSPWVSVGFGGTGILEIRDGATVSSPIGQIATNAPGHGTVIVDGAGSRWDLTGGVNFHVGGAGTGILNILNGGTVQTGTATIGIGDTGGTGTVTVDGPGSTLSNSADINVGNVGTGTLTLSNGGNVTTTGTLWIARGGASVGTLNIGAAPGNPAAAPGTVNAAAVQFGVGNGVINFNHTAADYVFAPAISGPGAVNQLAGTTVLTAANTYTGPTTISGGTLMVNGSIASPTTVNAGGTLGGIGTINNDVMNAGLVAPGPGPGGLGTLTIAGNYIGNGGTLAIKTALAGDPSPTDRLVVTGNTSGSTTVQVTNFGGAGAPTAEGIKIIDVGGASNGAFSLQGDYVIAGQPAVIAGAFAYTLQQNGFSTPTDGDWYLRSGLTNVPFLPGFRPPPPPPGSPPTPSDTPPPAPPGSPPSPPVPVVPLFQPGVPLYESYGQVLLGLNELSTLQQRVGNRHRGDGDAMAHMGPVKAVAGAPASVGPVWGRFEGRHLNLSPSSTARSSFDADYLKFEAGIDAVTFDQGFGKLVFGITGHYNEADADVSSFFGNGTIRTRGGGFGGTATWYGYDGFYVDGQARASWYASKLNSALIGPVISDNDGFGYALGVESGKRFALVNGWSLTPQAQLTYGSVDFDTFMDRFGANVSLGRAESLLGRAGISLDHQMTWRDASGRLMRSDLYGIANLHYEFLDGASVDVSGTRFASSADRLWGGIGAGGTFSWANDRYAIYGEVSYNTSLEDTGESYSYKGTAGFRVRW